MKLTKTAAVLFALSTLAHAPAFAGVVFQVETTYHSGSPGVETSEMSVEKPNLKMEIASGGKGARDTAIYNGDRGKMIVINHEEQSYMEIDPNDIKRIGAQVNDQMSQAMKQIESQMEGLDPIQREMMNKMLKGKMGGPSPMTPTPKRIKSEFRKSGERANKQGYPCVKYEVLRGGEKIQELWVTDWDNVKGGREVAASFKDMAKFFDDMMDATDEMTGADKNGFFAADRSSMDVYTKIDGFPVVTREFEGGELESETVLESVSERDLDPDAFEPPKGYRLRTMGPQ